MIVWTVLQNLFTTCKEILLNYNDILYSFMPCDSIALIIHILIDLDNLFFTEILTRKYNIWTMSSISTYPPDLPYVFQNLFSFLLFKFHFFCLLFLISFKKTFSIKFAHNFQYSKLSQRISFSLLANSKENFEFKFLS